MNRRKQNYRRFLTAALVSLLPVWATHAVAQANGGRGLGVQVRDELGTNIRLYDGSYALVIGESTYTKGWNNLRGVSSDVGAVSEALRRQGFHVDVVSSPTRTEFDQAVRDFIGAYGQAENNRLLIYFAGHGHTLKSGFGQDLGYVVPSDAPLPSAGVGAFKSRAVSMQEFESYARQVNAKHVLFIFDSCFSGSVFRVRAEGRVPPVVAAVTSLPVRQFITAGDETQQVPDVSVFRKVFIRGIEGEADLNHDGYVTGTELGMHLRNEVTNYTNRAQTPQWGLIRDPDLDRGDFVFVVPKNAPASANAGALEDEAEHALLARDFDGALRAAGEAARLNPQSARAYRLLASLYYNTDEDERGKANAERALALSVSPRTAREYEARGYAYWDKGEHDRAVADYTEAIRLDPTLTLAYNGRGNAYHSKGELDRAMADYTEAIRLAPTFVWGYYNRGNIYKERKEYDRAIADYNEAIRLDPKYAAPYNNRGNVYNYNKKNYDRAVVDYNEAIRLNPRYALAYSNRGSAYRGKGELDRAVADYTEAIRLNPKYALAYRNRGSVYDDRKEYDLALADYTEAIRLDPKDDVAYNNRGNVYKDRKEYDRAIADYNEAIRLDPKYAPTYSNRGNAYRGKREFDRALADHNEAIRLNPQYAAAYNNRATIYDDLKDYDRAVADFTEAIRLDPKYALAYKNRALAYEKMGDAARAKADRDKAAELENRR